MIFFYKYVATCNSKFVSVYSCYFFFFCLKFWLFEDEELGFFFFGILPILGVSLLPPCGPALSKLSFFNKVIFYVDMDSRMLECHLLSL